MITMITKQLTAAKHKSQILPTIVPPELFASFLTFLQKMLTQTTLGHIYQRTVDGFLLFYTIPDFLVFFSIVCVCSKRHKVKLVGICPMFDHTHLLAKVSARKEVSGFVQEYSSLYAREFNESIGKEGSVFRRNFGFASKIGMKSVKNACSYLYNNPGEKKLCQRAEEYRWSFLAYAVSDHPFSEKISLKTASRPLRRALKKVEYYASRDIYLRHEWLEDMFEPLSTKEKNQLIDYIIVAYNVIDYRELISYYESYEKACLAFASNQGSEHDIQEEFVPGSHRPYYKIPILLVKEYGIRKVKDVFRLPLKDRMELFYYLKSDTRIPEWQLKKYFRLKTNNAFGT